MGAATVSATTCADAPGYTVVTRMIGGAISGYCATGSVGNDTAPAIMISIAMTQATIGRRMKKWLNMAAPGRGGGLSGFDFLERRVDGDARPGPLEPVHDDPIPVGEPIHDHPHRAVQRPDLDPPHLHRVLVIHHEREAPVLIREQPCGWPQPLLGRVQEAPQRREEPGQDSAVLVLEPAAHTDRPGRRVESGV